MSYLTPAICAAPAVSACYAELGIIQNSAKCLAALIEAVRDQTRVVDLKQVNRVLIQPHWRKDGDQPIA